MRKRKRSSGNSSEERKRKRRKTETGSLVINISSSGASNQLGENENTGENSPSDKGGNKEVSRRRKSYNFDEEYVPYVEKAFLYGLPKHPNVKYLGKGLKLAFFHLIDLMNEKDAYIFNAPVDNTLPGCENYYDLIQKPMDFQTIHNKILNFKYKNLNEFASDMRLVFRNCLKFNSEGHWAHECGKHLRENFNQFWKSKLQPLSGMKVYSKKPKKKTPKVKKNRKKTPSSKTERKASLTALNSNSSQFLNSPSRAFQITDGEKRKLLEDMGALLTPEQWGVVVEIYLKKEKITKNIRSQITLNFLKMKDETFEMIEFYVRYYIHNCVKPKRRRKR